MRYRSATSELEEEIQKLSLETNLFPEISEKDLKSTPYKKRLNSSLAVEALKFKFLLENAKSFKQQVSKNLHDSKKLELFLKNFDFMTAVDKKVEEFLPNSLEKTLTDFTNSVKSFFKLNLSYTEEFDEKQFYNQTTNTCYLFNFLLAISKIINKNDLFEHDEYKRIFRCLILTTPIGLQSLLNEEEKIEKFNRNFDFISCFHEIKDVIKQHNSNYYFGKLEIDKVLRSFQEPTSTIDNKLNTLATLITQVLRLNPFLATNFIDRTSLSLDDGESEYLTECFFDKLTHKKNEKGKNSIFERFQQKDIYCYFTKQIFPPNAQSFQKLEDHIKDIVTSLWSIIQTEDKLTNTKFSVTVGVTSPDTNFQDEGHYFTGLLTKRENTRDLWSSLWFDTANQTGSSTIDQIINLCESPLSNANAVKIEDITFFVWNPTRSPSPTTTQG
jgi:hypothetical protein